MTMTLAQWHRKKRMLEAVLYRAQEAAKHGTPFNQQALYDTVNAAEAAIERHWTLRPK